eukprot:Tbor_TRINITY_DN4544_c0_g1::TRINITY_DN4544_c0_g1_i1::g.15707::m.15707
MSMLSVSDITQRRKRFITVNITGSVSLDVNEDMLDVIDDHVLREEILLEAVHIGLADKLGKFDRFKISKSATVYNFNNNNDENRNEEVSCSRGSEGTSLSTSSGQTPCYDVKIDFNEFSDCIYNLQEEYDRVMECAKTAKEVVDNITQKLAISYTTSTNNNNSMDNHISDNASNDPTVFDNIINKDDISTIKTLLNDLNVALTNACTVPQAPPHGHTDAVHDVSAECCKSPVQRGEAMIGCPCNNNNSTSSNNSTSRSSEGWDAQAYGYRLLEGDDIRDSAADPNSSISNSSIDVMDPVNDLYDNGGTGDF